MLHGEDQAIKQELFICIPLKIPSLQRACIHQQNVKSNQT